VANFPDKEAQNGEYVAKFPKKLWITLLKKSSEREKCG